MIIQEFNYNIEKGGKTKGLSTCFELFRYFILDVLGSGTFGQVVKCRNMKTQEIVAVKVVKNKLAYFKQSMMEVAILEMVKKRI